MDALQLFIICATVIGAVSILCYTASHIATSPNLIEVIRRIKDNQAG